MEEEKEVKILYTNWKGKKAWRTILPIELTFSSNEWHKEKQWIIKAIDKEKNQERTFTCKDIEAWKTKE
jgi:predicted DNA-binding transcriptional regulator YafY